MNRAALAPQTQNADLAPADLMPSRRGILQRKCACGSHISMGEECKECAAKKGMLQRKLTIGASKDPLEQEADRVADQVMSTPLNSAINKAPPKIQRFTGQAKDGLNTAPPSVERVLASSGRPLEPALRQEMEQRFGHDFSQVRVHTGNAAEQSAREVNAHAYTVGNNVVFGAGQFAPEIHEGRRLIAHELTHVVQQRDTFHIQRDVNQTELDQCIAELGGSLRYRDAGIPNADELERYKQECLARQKLTDPTCRIDVRATHIGGSLRHMPVWHLFVVHKDSSENESYYRGGPGGTCPGVDAGDYGTISTIDGPYVPGTVDWDPTAPSKTVLTGASACGKTSCLTSELRRIDGTCTPYSPMGPNSNTVVSTILSNCGIPRQKPVWIAPGWGDEYI